MWHIAGRLLGYVGVVFFVWVAVLPFCVPRVENARSYASAKPAGCAVSAACPPSRSGFCVAPSPAPAPKVDLSSPPAVFASYLRAFEEGYPTAMRECMSERLRDCCGCACCTGPCEVMRKTMASPECARALAYYWSLLPVIEKQYAALPPNVRCLEVGLGDCGRSNRRRFSFVLENGIWKMDFFEVPVPIAP